MKTTLAIIGLGKLGACMAAVYADKGHSVIGFDTSSKPVNAINNCLAPVKEPYLDKLIKKNKKRLRATESIDEAVRQSALIFIIVPTPSQKDGLFSLRFAKKACREIGKSLSEKKDYSLIVLTSTVLPGDSHNKLIPVLEKSSGKVCGRDFGYCYSPEFIAIGSVIRDLQKPDFFLIGEYDLKSGSMLESFYNSFSNSGVPIERMNIPSAEMTKISLNAFVTTKISFANTLTQIAERLPGVNVDTVTRALGKDRRIGPLYLKGGLGFGGPCFPRDNIAFSTVAKKLRTTAPIALATHRFNESLIRQITNHILKQVPKTKSIGVIGLAYKSGTPVTEESHSLKIIKLLCEKGYRILVFEPLGYEHARQELKRFVRYCENLKECVTNADALFVANPDKCFRQIPKLLPLEEEKILIDPWRQFFHTRFTANIKYIPFGVGPEVET